MDWEQRAADVKAYIEANPHCSRSRILKDLKLSNYALQKIGQVVKLPPKQNASIGGTHSASKARKAGRIFAIRKHG